MRRFTDCVLLVILLVHGAFAQSPKIVAKVALTNQSNAIPPTALVTPADAALYRVSAYMTVTSYNETGARWCFNIGWTDDVSQRSKQFQVDNTQNNGTPTWIFTTIVARDVGGKPLGYSVANTGQGCQGEQFQPFDLFITVEQIQ